MTARRLAAFVCAAAWALIAPSQAAQPGVSMATERRIDVPAGASDAKVDVDVSRTDGVPLLPGHVEVAVLSIAGPRGASIGVDALAPPAVRKGPVAGAVVVELRPSPQQLRASGTYTARVRVTVSKPGESAAAGIVTLVMTVPPATLDASSRAPRAVTLQADWPWSAASGVTSLGIAAEGRQALVGLGTSMREVRGPLAPMPAGATAAPAPVSPASAAASVSRSSAAAEAKVDIDPGAVAKVDVRFIGLPGAGMYTTALLVNAQTLDAPVEIPISVTVRDSWPWACGAILVGVAGGLWLHHLRTRWRVRQQARVSLLRLSQRLEQAAIDVAGAGPGLARRLRSARQAIDEASAALDEDADVSAKLLAIETQIEALVAALSAATDAVLVSIAEQRSEVEALDGFAHLLEPDQQTRLRDIGEMLSRAVDFAQATRIGTADAQRAEAERLLDDLQQAVVGGQAGELRRAFQAAGAVPPRAAELLRQALAGVSARPVTAAAFAGALAAVDAARELLPGAALAGAPAAVPAQAAATEGTGPRLTVVSQQPATALVETLFEWVAEPGKAPPATVAWDFGADPDLPAELGQATASHTYRRPGHYVVAATDTATQQTLRLSLQVTRSQQERERLGILARMGRAQGFLTALAAALATALGLQQLWVGKAFGTSVDYLFAFGWGLGIDQTVRGLAGVLTRVRGDPP